MNPFYQIVIPSTQLQRNRDNINLFIAVALFIECRFGSTCSPQDFQEPKQLGSLFCIPCTYVMFAP